MQNYIDTLTKFKNKRINIENKMQEKTIAHLPPTTLIFEKRILFSYKRTTASIDLFIMENDMSAKTKRTSVIFKFNTTQNYIII